MRGEGGEFRLKFWGVRGSIAAPGRDYVKYGGNTSCLEVRCADELLIIDLGTGARPLGEALKKEAPLRARVLLSHYHYDHICGAPFFGPFYDPGNIFDVYGEGRRGMGLKAVLSRQMSYPFFPVPIKAWGARIRFHTIRAGDTIRGHRLCIRTAALNHPQTAVAYRIEFGNRSLVYCSDNEHQKKMPAPLARLIAGCDVLIYDAAYTDDEYHGHHGSDSRVGWGHSTWTHAIQTARRLEVKKLFIFHHDPLHTDEVVDALLRRCRPLFPGLYAAREGQEISLL